MFLYTHTNTNETEMSEYSYDNITEQLFFALLRSAIRGIRLTENEINHYSDDVLQDLLKMSSKHSIANLIVLGLRDNKLIDRNGAETQRYILKTAYRCEHMQNEYKNLCDVLEKAQIPFVPLKGSVIRQYYPEAWMRTSCDIDILIHEEDIEKAKALLVNEHGYTDHGKGSHDVSLYSPRGFHIELHYSLIEEGRANESAVVLENMWNMVAIRHGWEYFYEMPDDLFYFYHIAHMVKHFENGGCGIRPFIDLWILDHIDSADTNKRDSLLNDGKLLTFANVARRLSRIWLENAEHDNVTLQMEEYILRGGVYGNNTNRIMVQQQKKGGRIKYALSKIFIPYDVIKFHYPILQKHRWLTPFMEVRRWCKLIFCGHLKRTTKELKYNSSVSNDEATNVQKFLSDIGL